MTDPRWLWSFDQTIPSNAGTTGSLRDEVLNHLKKAGWGKRDRFSVHLALEEALVNAIKHGNQMDPSKTVHVQCNLAKDAIEITVTDEGTGFNLAALPDPTDEIHRKSPNGRGVLLMRSFMDQVEFNDSGNQVFLRKHRSDAPPS
ncbi:MAG: ATP-binding protein [Planctomycetia bacterium]|jgi:serine/threonine-protein kinase RsbW